MKLFDPMDCCPPEFVLHGTLQATIIRVVLIPFSGSFRQDQTWVSFFSEQIHNLVWAPRTLKAFKISHKFPCKKNSFYNFFNLWALKVFKKKDKAFTWCKRTESYMLKLMLYKNINTNLNNLNSNFQSSFIAGQLFWNKVCNLNLKYERDNTGVTLVEGDRAQNGSPYSIVYALQPSKTGGKVTKWILVVSQESSVLGCSNCFPTKYHRLDGFYMLKFISYSFRG